MGTARPLQKLEQRDLRVQKLEAQLRHERRLRAEAEAQVKKFHALLIAERIRKIQARAVSPNREKHASDT